MIIVDTNVISEPLRPRPAEAVLAWLDDQAIETVYLTTITLAEIRFGIASLPAGKRQRTLRTRFDDEMLELFGDRILSFDRVAAEEYGDLRARAVSRGLAIGDLDAMIAAIAAARGFAVATRDVRPFIDAGIQVVNPFESGEGGGT
ncbi:PIN domain-containing protein [Epidermidibacterium keratini]|uniref:Ribonuclease VapC n=1 Tax=Epidermidibacterium keratini TaxID=1891644 RepID=A0A7L4YIS4_9ACTN|nr:type II toxin-antitoxin system VapC family toxin [Epidermidibacterium keratini]QHB99264.1 PIN domain-containing protein [Epidermidibacterium keratini]